MRPSKYVYTIRYYLQCLILLNKETKFLLFSVYLAVAQFFLDFHSTCRLVFNQLLLFRSTKSISVRSNIFICPTLHRLYLVLDTFNYTQNPQKYFRLILKLFRRHCLFFVFLCLHSSFGNDNH